MGIPGPYLLTKIETASKDERPVIKVNTQKCNGCAGRNTTVCQDICPGLLRRRGSDGKAESRDQSACWDCCACVKACPREALSLVLPFQICEAQLQMKVRIRRDETAFQIHDRDDQTLRKSTIPAHTKGKDQGHRRIRPLSERTAAGHIGEQKARGRPQHRLCPP